MALHAKRRTRCLYEGEGFDVPRGLVQFVSESSPDFAARPSPPRLNVSCRLFNQMERHIKLIATRSYLTTRATHDTVERRLRLIQISSIKRGGLWFALALNERGKMVACAFSEDSQRRAESAVIGSLSVREGHVRRNTAVTSSKLRELHGLYMGRRKADLRSLDLSNVSPFRRKVYLLLSRIPRGRVTTYGAIAKKVASRRYCASSWDSSGKQPHATGNSMPQGCHLYFEGGELWDARSRTF